ncbi:hypothetical protein F5887DRAFT_1197388 [Amanita rubescens]|nr:hypothetical protein F5887DRAFT_1197388 [Amanita rubescens]
MVCQIDKEIVRNTHFGGFGHEDEDEVEEEWPQLQEKDQLAAEEMLDLIKRLAIPLGNAIHEVMDLYASAGNVEAVERVMMTYLTDVPDEQQRHLHVKTHSLATPEGAIRLWVAPKLGIYVLLYTLMIRACASHISSGRSSEPERALDLWTEMTVDRRIMPTAYNAVILACAKSRLQQVRSAPIGRRFALYWRARKCIGDLARARWILAEMLRVAGPDGCSLARAVDASINEEVMIHVFHAYAAYNPPFVRSISPPEKDASDEVENTSAIPESSPDAPEAMTSGPPASEDVYPSFTHIPPQSRQEVIHEVCTLFQRILAVVGGQDNE